MSTSGAVPPSPRRYDAVPGDWLISINQQSFTAPDFGTLRQWRAEGRVPDTAFVYHPILGEWKPAKTIDVRRASTGATFVALFVAIPILLFGTWFAFFVTVMTASAVAPAALVVNSNADAWGGVADVKNVSSSPLRNVELEMAWYGDGKRCFVAVEKIAELQPGETKTINIRPKRTEPTQYKRKDAPITWEQWEGASASDQVALMRTDLDNAFGPMEKAQEWREAFSKAAASKPELRVKTRSEWSDDNVKTVFNGKTVMW